ADDAVRVWAPGCATGEEVYSVAISLIEFMRNGRIETPLQIFGTDLSEPALEKARAGIYPETIAADVSTERLRRVFVRVNSSYQISRSVRDACVFARQNVTKDPPFSKLDLILCRNVLIYLGQALQSNVMRLFHYALKPTGYLVLGMSESIGSAVDLFIPQDKKLKIYSRKPFLGPVATDFGAYEERQNQTASAPIPKKFEADNLHRRVDQILLSRHSPPAFLIDRDLQISQFRGQTGDYLEHNSGEANLNLLKMTPSGLGLEVRKLLRKAQMNNGPVKGSSLPISVREQVRNVSVTVTPVSAPGQPEPLYLVVLDAASPAPPTKPSRRGGDSKGRQAREAELEQELASTREYLQAVIEEQEAASEELKSAHEEVQSGNEELQSTNEELLTAKEELQSTNEELTTVNEEMQSRNAELQQLNNDLINLL